MTDHHKDLLEYLNIMGTINDVIDAKTQAETEKQCCHHLPENEHTKSCEDDYRGDYEYHQKEDNNHDDE